MKAGVRTDGVGIEAAAALGDDGVEVLQGGEVPVSDWLVDQRPQPLRGLKLRAIRG
jgi:hypothetical protein